MPSIRLVLGDQLSESLSALADLQGGDIVLMAEVMDEASYVRHHKQKIALIFAAMRHFAVTLADKGASIRYVRLDDPSNTQSISGEITRAVHDTGLNKVIVTEPGEWRLREHLIALDGHKGITLKLRQDDRFLISIDEFKAWARGRRQLRMEHFYRMMRVRHGVLLEPDGKPSGGDWNFDTENRKPIKGKILLPKRPVPARSAILEEVLNLVTDRFGNHFGRLEDFHWPVTRTDALIALDHFIDRILPDFGDHQDAMLHGEPHLFHSLLSSSINIGLLTAIEVIQRAEAAFRAGKVPIASAEGFIRQILGWREYVRGIYWHEMPRYAGLNALGASRPLPDFYWSTRTNMACLSDAVKQTRDHAYSHHIQRLMVTGNFALLAGLDVREVCDWYLAVYVDAFEWVELPNTLGMALHGDGGLMASKPYAASGRYINRMSNHCRLCPYDPEKPFGADACPFNPLYWHFIDRHHDRFRNNQRMGPIVNSWTRMDADRKTAILASAEQVLADLDGGRL